MIKKVQQFRSLILIILIRKNISKFVSENQAMIDNDPSKYLSFLSGRSGSIWRYSLFLLQDEKEPISLTSHEGLDEKECCKAFEQTQASPLTEHDLVFPDEKKFSQDQMVNSHNNSWLALFPQHVLIVMKTSPHHEVWGGH